ncbi:MAG: carbohydrate ABC transporter permease [Planctomycetota bacterium]
MKRVLANAVMWGGVVVMLAPIAWVLLASLRVGADVFDGGPLTLANYAELAGSPLLLRQIGNGLLLAGGGTALALVVCSLAGYALAKLRFAGRTAFVVACVAVLLLPAMALLPAVFGTAVWLGLFDTHAAVILPHAAAAFGALLYRQAMLSVPDETLDAARLDGCSEWRTWWSIALPQVAPVSALFVLLSFLALWNSYLWPQVVLASEAKQPLAVALANMAASPQYQTNYGLLMAATVVGLVPPAVVFVVCAQAWDRG